MLPLKTIRCAAAMLGLGMACAVASPVVVERNLYLRSGPGAQFKVVAVMPRGARVTVRNCNDGWCRVIFRNRLGYASSDYLGVATDAFAAAPPAEAEAEPPRVGGPRVWRWHDRNWRDRNWRRLQQRQRYR